MVVIYPVGAVTRHRSSARSASVLKHREDSSYMAGTPLGKNCEQVESHGIQDLGCHSPITFLFSSSKSRTLENFCSEMAQALPTDCFLKVSVILVRMLNFYFNTLSFLSFGFSAFKTIQNNYFCIRSTICHVIPLVIYRLRCVTTLQGYILAHLQDLRIKVFISPVLLEKSVL